jgi:carbamoyltransferase
MTTILGISAYYHDSAACLVRDGEIIAAAQEERFTRKKHDADFPRHAVAYCLREGNLKPEELDYVGFYDKPLLKFERILENYLGVAPKGLRSFLTAMPVWLKEKLFTKDPLRKHLGAFNGRVLFAEHQVGDISKMARSGVVSLAGEFWAFLRVRKKWWLAPMGAQR